MGVNQEALSHQGMEKFLFIGNVYIVFRISDFFQPAYFHHSPVYLSNVLK